MKNLHRKEKVALIVLILFLSFVLITRVKSETSKLKVPLKKMLPVAACTGDITLTTQAQVDGFPAMYGCTEITGTLTISGNDITNLDSLYSLTMVGKLTVSSNGSLTNLDGLSGLSKVVSVTGTRPDGVLISGNA